MLDEWNGCPEFFSLSRALEIFRQHLLLQKVIIFLKKKSLGAPELLNWVNLRLHVALSSWVLKLPIFAVLAMILGSKTSEMDFSTKTAQPRPQVLSVAVPFRGNCPVLSTSFSGYRKLLPNSVNASWLWRISRQI